MHPFLRSPKNLMLLGVGWLPVCIGVIVLNSIITEQTLLESSVLLVPAMVIELFICISTWHICRSVSLEHSRVLNIVVKHLIPMNIIIILWIVLINVYSLGLDRIFRTDIWYENFKKTLPILATMGFFFYFLACLIHYLLISSEKAKKAEHQALEQKLLASQSELKSIKTTIHPHFLFNSLTALSTLTQSDPQRAQEVCIQLSDFFRYNLRYSQKEHITVEDELKHVENYLNIEKTRLGDRLKTDIRVDQKVSSVPILPLTLLPLVENAVKHGVQQCIEGGTIHITIQRVDAHLQIKVTNPIDPLSSPLKGEGYGLASLKQRIHGHYGEDAHLHSKKNEKSFTVTIKIPF